MKFFVIYLGGSHAKSLIELHDMRFVVAETIEDTYEHLRKTWWGEPQSLHLDAWGSLTYADGYDISLHTTPAKNDSHSLFFVNLGGYDPIQFTELHKNVFVVARDKVEAKAKAKMQIMTWQSPHKDYLYEVDGIIDLQETFDNPPSKKYYIHLNPATQPQNFEFTVKYVPIALSLDVSVTS